MKLMSIPILEPNSIIGSILTWILFGIHSFFHSTLQDLSLFLAILVSIDTLTGSYLKNYIVKKIKSLKSKK